MILKVEIFKNKKYFAFYFPCIPQGDKEATVSTSLLIDVNVTKNVSFSFAHYITLVFFTIGSSPMKFKKLKSQ